MNSNDKQAIDAALRELAPSLSPRAHKAAVSSLLDGMDMLAHWEGDDRTVSMAVRKGIRIDVTRHAEDGHLSVVLNAPQGPRSVARDVLQGTRRVEVLPSARPLLPPLAKLEQITCWVPSRNLRKTLGKLIADDRADVLTYRARGDFRLAQWRETTCWFAWAGYVLVRPLTAAVRAVRAMIAGG